MYTALNNATQTSNEDYLDLAGFAGRLEGCPIIPYAPDIRKASDATRTGYRTNVNFATAAMTPGNHSTSTSVV